MLGWLYFDLWILGSSSENGTGNRVPLLSEELFQDSKSESLGSGCNSHTVDGLTTELPFPLFTVAALVMQEACSRFVATPPF